MQAPGAGLERADPSRVTACYRLPSEAGAQGTAETVAHRGAQKRGVIPHSRLPSSVVVFACQEVILSSS